MERSPHGGGVQMTSVQERTLVEEIIDEECSVNGGGDEI